MNTQHEQGEMTFVSDIDLRHWTETMGNELRPTQRGITMCAKWQMFQVLHYFRSRSVTCTVVPTNNLKTYNETK